jgi:hypothetical protein
MKIVSILVFLGAMVGSWCLVHSTRPVTESMHVGIQNDLKNIITDYVQKQLPNSQNLQFEKFWTETVKKDRVRASFVYSFEDSDDESGPVLTEIEGFAVLNKVEETPETVTWSLDELTIQDSAVNFQDPVRITGSTGELENESVE